MLALLRRRRLPGRGLLAECVPARPIRLERRPRRRQAPLDRFQLATARGDLLGQRRKLLALLRRRRLPGRGLLAARVPARQIGRQRRPRRRQAPLDRRQLATARGDSICHRRKLLTGGRRLRLHRRRLVAHRVPSREIGFERRLGRDDPLLQTDQFAILRGDFLRHRRQPLFVCLAFGRRGLGLAPGCVPARKLGPQRILRRRQTCRQVLQGLMPRRDGVGERRQALARAGGFRLRRPCIPAGRVPLRQPGFDRRLGRGEPGRERRQRRLLRGGTLAEVGDTGALCGGFGPGRGRLRGGGGGVVQGLVAARQIRRERRPRRAQPFVKALQFRVLGRDPLAQGCQFGCRRRALGLRRFGGLSRGVPPFQFGLDRLLGGGTLFLQLLQAR